MLYKEDHENHVFYEGAEVLLDAEQTVALVGHLIEDIHNPDGGRQFPSSVCGGHYWIEKEILDWVSTNLPFFPISESDVLSVAEAV